MKWRDATLGDLITLKRGHDLAEQDRVDGPVPVVSSSGITGRHNQAVAQPPGIVTGRYGTIGEVFYIDEPYWPLNTALYAVDFHRNHPRFLAYLLMQALRRAQPSKAAVPGVNRNDLHKIPVRCPDLATQRRIADILSAYDDLIENNRRRIHLLESTARLLYEEWFVRLRFPGYQHTKIVNGLPQGWQLRPLSESAQVLSGGTPRTSNPNLWGGEIPFYTPKDAGESIFADQTERSLTERGLRACNSSLFQARTLFISARGTVGKISLAAKPMAMNQTCYALVARPPRTEEFLYFAVRNTLDALRARAAGSVFAAITRETFTKITSLVPPARTIADFTEQAKPTLDLAANLQAQNRILARARDLLLPRLMSGELEV